MAETEQVASRVDHPLSVTLRVDEPGADPTLGSRRGEIQGGDGLGGNLRRLSSWGVRRFHVAHAELLSRDNYQELQNYASRPDLHLIFSVGDDPAEPDLHLPAASRIHIPVSLDSSRSRFDFVGRCNADGFRVRALSLVDPRQPELLLELGSELAVRDVQEWTISPPLSSADEQWLVSDAGGEPHFIGQVKERFPWMQIEYASFQPRENSLLVNSGGALFTTDPVTARRVFLGWLDELEVSDLRQSALFDLGRHLNYWIHFPLNRQPDLADPVLPEGGSQAIVSYDNSDWSEVKNLALRLRNAGVRVWVDKWDLQPGSDWLQAIEKAMDGTSVMLLIIGSKGKIVSPYQLMEPTAFLQEMKSMECRIIPVVLENAPAGTEIPRILRSFSLVDFRQPDPDPFGQLIWGITGTKPVS